MKIDLIWKDLFEDGACYKITIEDIEDYEVLSLLIIEDDYIDDVYVKYVEYNTNEWDSIKIYGIKTNNNLTEFEIRDMDEIIIYRFKYIVDEKYDMKKQYEIVKHNAKQYAAYCQLNELKNQFQR